MKCPRCESSLLELRERSGFVFERCPSCRGIWIDRGELETLVSQAVTELQGIGSREAEPRRVREVPVVRHPDGGSRMIDRTGDIERAADVLKPRGLVAGSHRCEMQAFLDVPDASRITHGAGTGGSSVRAHAVEGP